MYTVRGYKYLAGCSDSEPTAPPTTPPSVRRHVISVLASDTASPYATHGVMMAAIPFWGRLVAPLVATIPAGRERISNSIPHGNCGFSFLPLSVFWFRSVGCRTSHLSSSFVRVAPCALSMIPASPRMYLSATRHRRKPKRIHQNLATHTVVL